MKAIEAERLALDLMEKHGLIDKGWVFKFDRAVRRFGQCTNYKRLITISKPLTEINEEFHVKNTILHEIAHALAGPGHGHDKKWKAIAISIGNSGQRCYSSSVVQVPASRRVQFRNQWIGRCTNCGHETRPRSRRGNLACRLCCQKNSGGRWDERYKLEWVAFPHRSIRINRGPEIPVTNVSMEFAT